jgi:hypothetical protein
VSGRGGYLHLPLWSRWLLSVIVAIGVLVLIVVFVQSHNSDAPENGTPAQQARANHEGEIVVEEDQAPHVARFAAGLAPATAITRVVRAYVAGQVARGTLDGPLQHSSCKAVGAHRPGGSLPFSCTVQAASVTYPFLGVVDVRDNRVTYCKHDPPPVPSENIPVSRRCRV